MPDQPPQKPTLAWDGECNLCRVWVDRWKEHTGDQIHYEPLQTAADRFPHIPKEQLSQALHLIMPEGKVYSGAEAVFHTLAMNSGRGTLLWMYEHIPGFAAVSEWAYRFVSKRRPLFFTLMRWFVGKDVRRPTHVLTRDLLFRAIGLIYLIAFLSLFIQIPGLIGSHGILPADQFLQAVKTHYGIEGYFRLPTLAWLNAGDGFLQALALLGAAASILVVLGLSTAPLFLMLWALYLSLAKVGQQFTAFQWDTMLLEAGFLAMLFAPFRWWPKPKKEPSPPGAFIWLTRLFLFRFMLGSGIVKLTSGDLSWRNLTALQYHYLTQPLPNPLAWYAYRLPLWFHQASVAATFFIELVVPFFFFAPRRLRFIAAYLTIFLQLAIFATGNYTFFNLLTIVLCISLFDDAFLRQLYPKKTVEKLLQTIKDKMLPKMQRVLITIFTPILVVAGLLTITGQLVNRTLPAPAMWFLQQLEGLSIVNPYGAFAIMTTRRYEIVIEGSNDGKTWFPYEFKYKPGDVRRALPIVEPHQPRLDWLMWFLPFGNPQENPWLTRFAKRLLEGSPQVLNLLASNPFANQPPRYIRAVGYEYYFTDLATKQRTGAWWTREYKGIYLPPVSLK